MMIIIIIIIQNSMFILCKLQKSNTSIQINYYFNNNIVV